MKKILMFVVGASQLLLLPQINALDEVENQRFVVPANLGVGKGLLGRSIVVPPKFEVGKGLLGGSIVVPQKFEVGNGLLELDRYGYSMLVGAVIKKSTPKNAEKKFRNLCGISEETNELRGMKFTLFEMALGELAKQKKLKRQIFQQPIEVLGPNASKILASNGEKALIAINYSDSSNHHLMHSADGGKSWYNTAIYAEEVKYINGNFFAFGARRVKYNKNNIDFIENNENIYVSQYGTMWTPFFTSVTYNTKGIRTMAYGDDKYVIVTESGHVLIKTEKSEWKELVASVTNSVLLDEQEEKINKKSNNNTFSFLPLRNYDPGYNKLENIEIVYGRGNFVLRFSHKDKSYFYSSKDAENWKFVKSDQSKNSPMLRNLVGGSIGFAYIGEEKQLYYSLSGDGWAKATLPVKPNMLESFFRVLYVDSSFYGDMFVALSNEGKYASQGILTANGIEWSWGELDISLPPTIREPMQSRQIANIYCLDKKIVI
ncbi:MAG: hypothetical protein LBT70_00120 [Holosporaceae bacterium]|jgi:hypothetical protein|nr:hypothetical protein [Holosporaceae bacterium]